MMIGTIISALMIALTALYIAVEAHWKIADLENALLEKESKPKPEAKEPEA